MEVVRNVHKSMLGKPEGKKPLVRPSCKWEDNIKTDVNKIEWESVD
jgi:hypothetical protein